MAAKNLELRWRYWTCCHPGGITMKSVPHTLSIALVCLLLALQGLLVIPLPETEAQIIPDFTMTVDKGVIYLSSEEPTEQVRITLSNPTLTRRHILVTFSGAGITVSPKSFKVLLQGGQDETVPVNISAEGLVRRHDISVFIFAETQIQAGEKIYSTWADLQVNVVETIFDDLEPRSVSLDDQYLFLADTNNGLMMMNISNANTPRVKDTTSFGNNIGASNLDLDKNYVYGAYGEEGLWISSRKYDNLGWTGQLDTDGFAHDVASSGSYVFVADGDNGLLTVDCSIKSRPELANHYSRLRSATRVEAHGDHVFVVGCADSDELAQASLLIFSISEKRYPRLIEIYRTPGLLQDVAVSGDHAYLADHSNGLLILDISSPEEPELLGQLNTNGFARSVKVSGGMVFLADDYGGFHIVDVNDPKNPELVKSYDTNGIVIDAAVSDTNIYIVDEVNGLLTMEIDPETRRRMLADEERDIFGLQGASPLLYLFLVLPLVISSAALWLSWKNLNSENQGKENCESLGKLDKTLPKLEPASDLSPEGPTSRFRPPLEDETPASETLRSIYGPPMSETKKEENNDPDPTSGKQSQTQPSSVGSQSLLNHNTPTVSPTEQGPGPVTGELQGHGPKAPPAQDDDDIIPAVVDK
jgi:hypothetical protein